MSNEETIVIVGAGPAGGQAALTLREEGYQGRVILVGAEPYLPYERPPLSKATLTDPEHAGIPLLPGVTKFNELNIEFRKSTYAIAIDVESQSIKLNDGTEQKYNKLLLTTGARLRRLEIDGSDLQHVYYLRDFDDSQNIKARLQPGKKLVVIGGGFIGLETAASARKLGCDVTVIEAGPQLMGRVVPSVIANFFTELHQKHGINIITGVMPEKITGEGQVSGVQLADGRFIEADVILVGIGVLANVELAEQAGLAINNGIVVNEYTQTSVVNIYAAGDVTCHFNPLLKKSYRHESWQNAINQASIAAINMAGESKAHAEVPWVWTDQLEVNMQMAGVVHDSDDLVIRGSIENADFTVFQMYKQQVVGVITINRGKEMTIAKRLVGSGKIVDPKLLQDDSNKLRKIIKG
ncbi:MAG: FAD-dependent oxidoreductase [Colwellia sp.]|nr:FAD-dependent oxidoreductase [Colwellia sp.]MCW8863712.1 FAD-dependent oxidoreductase [Colwellia sp.]MCW9081351.1 FAD-dependent oxidoreductase [Colwellia sp.]